MVPKEIFLAMGRIPKVVALTRRRLLCVGLLGDKFRERASSLVILSLLEGGEMAMGCGVGGFC